MSYIKELCTQYKNEHERMKENVLAICQDNMNIPLEERWELASENRWAFDHGNNRCGHLLDEHHVSGEVCWYDEFGKDRYAVVDFFDLFEEEFTEKEWETEGLLEYCGPYEPSKTWKNVADVKEAILQSGIGSFTNDW